MFWGVWYEIMLQLPGTPCMCYMYDFLGIKPSVTSGAPTMKLFSEELSK